MHSSPESQILKSGEELLRKTFRYTFGRNKWGVDFKLPESVLESGKEPEISKTGITRCELIVL